MFEIIRVTRRELAAFFGSPVAYLFIGTFLAVSLFVFFWVEAFFARNLADVRPLFEWMPILLIFLCAALTMRLWSEERRAGTLETLLTLPVSTTKLVLGKFFAAFGLVKVALALTLPLPITVALIGSLDWGPVIGAYLATLLLAATYLAIGLFISARTDNSIIALIGSTLICSLFYLIGSPTITALFGHNGGELLRLLGSGARFASITRGVIDLRDLIYYLSLTTIFLMLTVDSLERLRWANAPINTRQHRRWSLVIMLSIVNLLAVNLWLQPINTARLDLTQGQLYRLSETTRNYLNQLQEPLLIRGYFSAQTHPLLAPLVPQLRDLLAEFAVVGNGRVRVEIIDLQQSPELEREAGEQYGIHPVAFQTETKYQAAVVNSYFDVLVKYGDQFETLNFQDLIEIKARSESDLEVRLRNPEYDLTRAIKKVLYAYRSSGDVFANLTAPVQFHGFISDAAQLPEPLPALRQTLETLLGELAAQSAGKFTFEIQDPAAGDGALAKTIQDEFGFEPLRVDLLNPTPFYFYMVAQSGEEIPPNPPFTKGGTDAVSSVQKEAEEIVNPPLEKGSRVDFFPIPLPESLDKAGLQRAIEAAIKRFTPGVLRTIALYTPANTNDGGQYSLLQQALQEHFSVRETDLTNGQVPEDADLLMVIAPENLDVKQQFAIDQFLMQGGTVIIAASSFNVDLGGDGITAAHHATGLEHWFGALGLRLEPSLVLDPHNTPFPIPVEREVGGFAVQEVQTLDYPYFMDVRGDGLMSASAGITANLEQLTLNWASPLEVDAAPNASRTVTPLLQSSTEAWTSDSEQMQPDFETDGALGFPRGNDSGPKLLAVAIEGQFQSPFAEIPPNPPLSKGGNADDDTAPADETAREKTPPVISGVVEMSPATARLIVIGSASFLSDTAISLASEATQSRYLKSLEFMQNAVEWALEDRGLLSLRGRGQFSRLLMPLSPQGQMLWEALNDLLALGGLALVYGLARWMRVRRERMQVALLHEVSVEKLVNDQREI
ncbi:Gldg family protein [Chromatium okenii]|uniref:Gldg family protein n=1 Tax=Chromatium okenii TaxID=61644 RepID=UPI0026F005C6|nr:Gldg family protein [Chromatium okenii]MBV5310314.1 Gldg family protein [Chromatium okenii]